MNELNLKSRETLRAALGAMEQSAPVAADLESYRPRRRSVRPLRKLSMGVAVALAVVVPTLVVPIQVPSVTVAPSDSPNPSVPAFVIDEASPMAGVEVFNVLGEAEGRLYINSHRDGQEWVVSWDPTADVHEYVLSLGPLDNALSVVAVEDEVAVLVRRGIDGSREHHSVVYVRDGDVWTESLVSDADFRHLVGDGPVVLGLEHDWERGVTRAWTSADLETWTEAGSFNGSVSQVIWSGDQFVAVGGSALFPQLDNLRPAIWVSSNGGDWSREDIQSKPWRLRLNDGLEYVVALPDGSVLAGVGAQAWQLTGTWPPIDPGEAGTLIYRNDGSDWAREYWDDVIIYNAVEYDGGVLGFGKRSNVPLSEFVIDGSRYRTVDVQEGNVIGWTTDLETWQLDSGPAVGVMYPLEGKLVGQIYVGNLCCRSQLATLTELP